MLVRWGTPGDESCVHELVRRAWDDAFPHIYTPEELDAFFARDVASRTTWEDADARRVGRLVGECEARVVGAAGLLVRSAGDGEFKTLYVDPDAQGQGIGTLLWERGLRELAARGCRHAQVWTLARGSAVAFYRARGCEPLADGTFWIGEHAEPAVGFRLATDPA